jgi:hypothetical protein
MLLESVFEISARRRHAMLGIRKIGKQFAHGLSTTTREIPQRPVTKQEIVAGAISSFSTQ